MPTSCAGVAGMPKVYIDPGHGGTDPGAIAGARQEKDDNLRYALELKRLFEAQGCEVIMARTTDAFVALNQRTAQANSLGADVYLSCHRNGGGGTGIELWLHSQAPARYITWAQDIIAGCKALPMPIRNGATANRVSEGVFKGYLSQPTANYAINRDTTMPSMLVELGFMGGDDAAFDAHYKDYAQVIAKATCKFLGVGWRDIPAPENPQGGPSQEELDRLTGQLAEATRERDDAIAQVEISEARLQEARNSIADIQAAAGRLLGIL